MGKQQQSVIYLLSFLSGFLSLGIEVLWVRIISFAGHSVPQAFSYTLTFFLLGIATGSWLGKQICKRRQISATLVGTCFLLAAIIDLELIAIAIGYMDKPSFINIAAWFVFISAMVRGLVFPLVHHLGTSGNKSGKQISNVYFANVVGSSLSPILIGFIALDIFSTQQLYFIICLVSAAVFLLCIWSERQREYNLAIASGAVILVSVIALTLPEKIFHQLSQQNISDPNQEYLSQIIENKHGFIQIYQSGEDKVVYGANVYDGKFNTNLFHNINGIDRAYLLPAVKPNIRKVLVIGLSTGSWAKVLASIPEMQSMTVVEINPAYIDLIRQEPEVAGLLSDNRIHIVVDDGRKWLRKHPNEKFDLILMNTTWHWRAYSSNLLSQDFLKIVQNHLADDGLLMYNSTYSFQVPKTAITVFAHVYLYQNMVLASFQPIDIPNNEQLKHNLSRLRWQDTQAKVFNAEQLELTPQKVATSWLHTTKVPYEEGLEVITDNNMITEFKYGRNLFQ